MKTNNKQLAQFLLDSGLVEEKDIQSAQKNTTGEKWADTLVSSEKITDEQLSKPMLILMEYRM